MSSSAAPKAPCESCPCGCAKCAWDHRAAIVPSGIFGIIRTEQQYGCAKGGAVVIDQHLNIPLMRIGNAFHPLSAEYGGVIVNTRLERDIAAALTSM